ncbi:hypothetical protein CDE51_07825 [Pasteurella multocida]|nr:hypothetical protein CDE51_07825 [Pasteurella multocida]
MILDKKKPFKKDERAKIYLESYFLGYVSDYTHKNNKCNIFLTIMYVSVLCENERKNERTQRMIYLDYKKTREMRVFESANKSAVGFRKVLNRITN